MNDIKALGHSIGMTHLELYSVETAFNFYTEKHGFKKTKKTSCKGQLKYKLDGETEKLGCSKEGKKTYRKKTYR